MFELELTKTLTKAIWKNLPQSARRTTPEGYTPIWIFNAEDPTVSRQLDYMKDKLVMDGTNMKLKDLLFTEGADLYVFYYYYADEDADTMQKAVINAVTAAANNLGINHLGTITAPRMVSKNGEETRHYFVIPIKVS